MKFAPHLLSLAEPLGLEIPPSLVPRFEALGEALVADPLYPSVSKIFDPAEIASRHFLDALLPLALPLPCWKDRTGTILDLGTGGGFPALPLALFLPDRQVIAVDAKGKSVEFVQRIGAALGLTNLRTVLGRAEEIGHRKEFRESVDLVVCRAVAAVRVLVEYCVPLAKVGGHVLLYKGPNLDEELTESANAFSRLGIGANDRSRHVLEPPLTPFSRGFVLIEKKRPTADTWPRRNGVPSSKPL